MEGALRALQQQVSPLQNQNAALQTQLRCQLNIAQALQELLVDQKDLGKPPVFSSKEEDFYVWAKKVENYVSDVFANVRGAFIVCSGIAGRGHSDSSRARCACTRKQGCLKK